MTGLLMLLSALTVGVAWCAGQIIELKITELKRRDHGPVVAGSDQL
jgi:hypothetical protein